MSPRVDELARHFRYARQLSILKIDDTQNDAARTQCRLLLCAGLVISIGNLKPQLRDFLCVSGGSPRLEANEGVPLPGLLPGG